MAIQNFKMHIFLGRKLIFKSKVDEIYKFCVECMVKCVCIEIQIYVFLLPCKTNVSLLLYHVTSTLKL